MAGTPTLNLLNLLEARVWRLFVSVQFLLKQILTCMGIAPEHAQWKKQKSPVWLEVHARD